MPYAYDPNQDPDQQQQDPNNPQLASGGGGPVGGASATQGAGAAPGGGAAPTSSGSFQNLNDYLDANKGSDFGQKFVGKVNDDVNAAGSAQDQAATEFKGASDAGTVKQNQDVLNNALNDPYGFSQDANNVSAFQGQLNAKYSGPQSYADDQSAYQKASGATQKAEDTAQAAQSEGGRFSLLNNYFGTPDYNQGQKSLDNLLIQADPTTSQGITQARQNADQSQVAFQGQAAPLQQYAAANNATTQATAAATQKAGSDAITGMNTDYAKALTDAQAAQKAEQARIQAGLAQGAGGYNDALSRYGLQGGPADTYDDQYAQIIKGVQPGTVAAPGGDAHIAPGTDPRATLALNSNFWGVDPSSFLTNGQAPNQSSVLSVAQQQKLDALQGLMGQATTPFDSSLAGTFDPSKAVSFDAGGYGQAEQTAAANYNQFQGNILNNVKGILNQGARGSFTGNNAPNQDVLNQVQAQYDQLNQSRAKYGLPPVKNPYTLAAAQAANPGTSRGHL